MTDVTDTAASAADAFEAGEHMGTDDFSSYLAGRGPADQTKAMERHCLVCKECRHALVEAGRRRASAARTRLIRRATPFAATALVVAATTVVLRSPAPVEPILRGGQETSVFLAVGPIGAAVVRADDVVLTWRAAATDAYYVLTLIDASGDVVWSTEPADTTSTLPPSVGLESGSYYFWFVDAFLDGANSATTGMQEFQVR